MKNLRKSLWKQKDAFKSQILLKPLTDRQDSEELNGIKKVDFLNLMIMTKACHIFKVKPPRKLLEQFLSAQNFDDKSQPKTSQFESLKGFNERNVLQAGQGCNKSSRWQKINYALVNRRNRRKKILRFPMKVCRWRRAFCFLQSLGRQGILVIFLMLGRSVGQVYSATNFPE